MTPTVELIYDSDCPNVEKVRDALRAGLSEAGLTPTWTEWDRAGPEIPGYARPFGSPSVLVNGRDVGGARAQKGDAFPQAGPSACRVYMDDAGVLRGVPSVFQIVAALQKGEPQSPHASHD